MQSKCNNPDCNYVYLWRKKPPSCPDCKAYLGGKYENKKMRGDIPSPCKIDKVVLVENSTYSVHNNRHFRVICQLLPDGSSVCSQKTCQEALDLNRKTGTLFTCSHGKLAKETVAAIPEHKLLNNDMRVKLGEIVVDVAMREMLTTFIKGGETVGLKINQFAYIFRAKPSSTNPLPWIHVYVTGEKITCSLSNRCQRGAVKTGKKDQAKLRCVHEELVRIYLGLVTTAEEPTSTVCTNCSISFSKNTGGCCKHCKDKVKYCTVACQESHWPIHQIDCSKTVAYLKNTAEHIMKTVVIPDKLEVLNAIKHRNAVETMGQQGWPRTYYTNVEKCPSCDATLLPGTKKKQKCKDNDTYLVTQDHCFPVFILSKKCKSCFLIIQPECLRLGLLNVGDTMLLALEIVYTMQRLIRRGLPPQTSAKAIVEELSERTDIQKVGYVNYPSYQFHHSYYHMVVKFLFYFFVSNESMRSYEFKYRNQEYMETRIVDAFYAFEALSKRPPTSLLCGICGIIPDVLLGDGNEDVSCRMSEANWQGSSKNDDTLTKQESDNFFDNLRCHFVNYLIMPSVARELKFVLKIDEVPPIVNTLAAGELLYSSEHLKDSKILKNRDKLFGNQELLMHCLREGVLVLDQLDSYTKPELMDLCLKLGFENLSSLPSMAMKKTEILKLYQSILTGASQCHFTGNEKHASGGWYTFVCPHGLIYASKLLFLRESVRDAADLWLSLRYRPPVTISDTPCTLSSILLLREPERAVSWFETKKGCFEEPTLGKKPQVVNIPELQKTVVSGDPSSLGPEVHPRSGEAKKYIVEDRFHGSTNPHKNELCSFHSANWCPQLTGIATAQQEQLNCIKNNLRLRSTCTQRPERHLMYNMIMDEYHNETIVKKQMSLYGRDREPHYQYLHSIDTKKAI